MLVSSSSQARLKSKALTYEVTEYSLRVVTYVLFDSAVIYEPFGVHVHPRHEAYMCVVDAIAITFRNYSTAYGAKGSQDVIFIRRLSMVVSSVSENLYECLVLPRNSIILGIDNSRTDLSKYTDKQLLT